MGSGALHLYLQTQTKADSRVGEREVVHGVGASGLDIAPVVTPLPHQPHIHTATSNPTKTNKSKKTNTASSQANVTPFPTWRSRILTSLMNPYESLFPPRALEPRRRGRSAPVAMVMGQSAPCGSSRQGVGTGTLRDGDEGVFLMGDNNTSRPKHRSVSPVTEVGWSSPRIRDGPSGDPVRN
jgi:hypothetical protein